MKAKYWRNHRITRVMRTFHSWGWTNKDVLRFFEDELIPVSENTIATERHKFLRENGICAVFSTDENKYILDWINRNDFTLKMTQTRFPLPKSNEQKEEILETTNTQQKSSTDKIISVDEESWNKVIEFLNTITKTVTDLRSVAETQTKEIENLNVHIGEVENIALASCKKIEVELPDDEISTLEEFPHPKLEYVLRLVQGAVINGVRRRINVMLIGPAGSGKTFLAGQVARTLKLPFAFISCSSGMSESQLLGCRLPNGKHGEFIYVPSQLVEKCEHGGLFLLDEIDAADSNTVIVLNSLLSGDAFSIPSRTSNPIVKKHSNFVIMAAANTFGSGADRLYVGRNQLDEAFLDRWRMGQVELEYSLALESHLCPDEELRMKIQKYRNNAQKANVRRVISSRFLEQAYIAKVAKCTDEDIEKALFGGWKKEEIEKAKGSY